MEWVCELEKTMFRVIVGPIMLSRQFALPRPSSWWARALQEGE